MLLSRRVDLPISKAKIELMDENIRIYLYLYEMDVFTLIV